MAALGTAAIKSYADCEQLVGGVETLFKTSADVVTQYANNAYKTAGMSANQYMETVTSFSASLLQSLGGDTEKAAQIGDMAITDMSDNVNKMGSSVESIQNAYQGFAKQNYTMLDNLKLGYGGTKTEMERLLKDAEKISGIKYDISNLSDVYSAIHVIQEEMGITGTTAKEASTTISGSMGMVKASFSNLLTGVADDSQDFDKLVNNFVDSVSVAAENILPRVEVAITGAGKLIEKLLPVIINRAPKIINNVLPKLVESGANMIRSVVSGLHRNLPEITRTGGEILSSLAIGILQIMPTLSSVAYDIVMNLLSGITDNSDSVLKSGSELLLQFISGIVEKIPNLLVAGAEAIISLAMALTEPDTLCNIIEAGFKLMLGLLDGVIQALPKLLESAPIIMGRFAATIIANIPRLLTVAVSILVKLAQYMVASVSHLLTAVPQLFVSLVNSFKSMDWGRIGKNIIDGIWSGISSGWNWLVDKVKELARSLFGAAKKELDINSPSKKFKWLAQMCVAGWDEGSEGLLDIDPHVNRIRKSFSVMKMNGNGSVPVYGGGRGTINQIININQPLRSPDEMARAARLESRYWILKEA